MRLMPPGGSLPPAAEIEAEMNAAISDFTFRSRIETDYQREHTYEASAVEQYATAWRTLAQGYAGLGDEADEARALAKARVFWPDAEGAP